MPAYITVSGHFSDIISTLINEKVSLDDPIKKEEIMEMYLIIGSLLQLKYKDLTPESHSVG
jgi:hypothetical protein